MKNLFIGIDFSKEKIDVVVLSAEGLSETAPRVFGEFENSKLGFRQFVKWVKQNAGVYDQSQWLFCGENTGDYSRQLANFLCGKGYDLWLENAKCIKDASGLRRLKTDRADASMIAEYAMRNHDRAVVYEPLGELLAGLRELYLQRQFHVRTRSSYMVRLSEKEHTLEKLPGKKEIVRSLKHTITELNKEIAKIDKMITELVNSDEELSETYKIVTSVPGIGTQNAVCLMVYTNNFRKFDYNPRKIACFYGIAPFGRDSGTSVHSDPHVHHMANCHLKAMLTQAALVAVSFNPVIREYYERLLARGKKTQVALNNVKNKLIRIVTTMVKNRLTFNPDFKIYSLCLK